MKKKIMSVLLCLALLVAICPKPKANADALTLGMIGAATYAIGQSLGISWTMSGMNGQGASNYIENKINSWLGGQSLVEKFGAEIVRITAGKMIVPMQMYNGILSFFNEYLSENEGATGSNNAVTLIAGNISYSSLGTEIVTSDNATRCVWGVANLDTGEESTVVTGTYLPYRSLSNDGIKYESGRVLGLYSFQDGASRVSKETRLGTYTGQVSTVALDTSGYVQPNPLPQNKEWEGDFAGTPGFADPPTDLPDFLSRIPVGIAENNLAVTGEIVEVETGGDLPTPSPSPSPSPNPSPDYNKGSIALIIAEILSLINSLSGDTAVDTETIDQVAQEVAEQAQTVPDTITQTATHTQEAIQDATQTMTDTLTQTQTQTQTAIQDATQTITDTITETQTETKDAIQDQTQEITDIKDAVKDATDVPTRDKWEQVKKDLHGVFPFCIPWDIYGMLTAFSAEPRAPHFEYPFQIPSIGLDYTLELDFADFDPVAQVLRTVELIAFSIGLAILTSKVIRW